MGCGPVPGLAYPFFQDLQGWIVLLDVAKKPGLLDLSRESSQGQCTTFIDFSRAYGLPKRRWQTIKPFRHRDLLAGHAKPPGDLFIG